MKDKIINKMVKDLTPLIIQLYYHNDLICPNCIRKVPNKSWFTKTACIWCDGDYWFRKQIKDNHTVANA